MRREPQPPMPTVIPLSMPATASSAVMVLTSAISRSALSLKSAFSPVATKASRASSATPARLSSKVKPCSKRYERFTSTGSMPLSDSLAARITVGLLAAISSATSRAAAISSSRGTTRRTEP